MTYIGDSPEKQRHGFNDEEDYEDMPTSVARARPKRKSLSDWYEYEGDSDSDPTDDPEAFSKFSRSPSTGSLDSRNVEEELWPCSSTNGMDQTSDDGTSGSPREETLDATEVPSGDSAGVCESLEQDEEEDKIHRRTGLGKLLNTDAAVFVSNDSVREYLKEVHHALDQSVKHLEAADASKKRADELCASEMASGNSVNSGASASTDESKDGEAEKQHGDEKTDLAKTAEAEYREQQYKYSQMIFRVPDPQTTENFPKFEGGMAGHLQDLLKDGSKHIDIVCFGFKGPDGKSRWSAPHPDVMAENMKNLFGERFNKRLEKDSTSEGDFLSTDGQRHKESIIAQNRAYAKVFEEVMQVGRPCDGPSLEGGLESVVELLDDVRTSAWNMAAFIFRRG